MLIQSIALQVSQLRNQEFIFLLFHEIFDVVSNGNLRNIVDYCRC
jgi:hypothetical protein